MTAPTDEQAAALALALDTMARRYKLAESRGPEQPLNEVDKLVLLYIGDHAGCGPSDVARFLGVANTTLTSAADRLVKRELVDRQRAQGDRRAVALRLSEAGARRFKAVKALHRDIYLNLLMPLSDEDRNALVRIMTQMAKNED